MLIELAITGMCGALVGLALGLTGGGGSIFALPVLVYALGITPAEAAAVSLVAVGLTALVGGFQSIRADLVVWQPMIMFAIGGSIGAPLGVWAARYIPAQWIVVGFAIMASIVGFTMWVKARTRPEQAMVVRAVSAAGDDGAICVLAADGQLRYSAPCAIALAGAGLGTGALSGIFGVGGGFLIVPALMFVTRMGVHRAVGTSLLVIGAIGLAGSAGAIWRGGMNWNVLAPFAFGGAVAMIAARRIAGRIAGPVLQKWFSILIVAVGVVMLVDGLT